METLNFFTLDGLFVVIRLDSAIWIEWTLVLDIPMEAGDADIETGDSKNWAKYSLFADDEAFELVFAGPIPLLSTIDSFAVGNEILFIRVCFYI